MKRPAHAAMRDTGRGRCDGSRDRPLAASAIGTAKVTPEQQALVPHHLLDIVDPDEILTLAEFQTRAYATIEAIHQRKRLPILVGGTGQWVQAVVEGWGIPRVPPDPALRAALEVEAQTIGPTAFHARLAAVDPQAAQKLDPRNVRRVIRALEVYHKTGVPISQHQRKTTPPYHTLQIGLTAPRQALYRRIDQRVGLVGTDHARIDRDVAA